MPLNRERNNNETKVRHFLASQKQPVRIKIAVLGSPNTGKKCFLQRLTRGMYTTAYDPAQDWFYTKNISLFDRFLSVEFTPVSVSLSADAATMHLQAVMANHDFVVVAYNVSSQASFDEMQGIYARSVEMRRDTSGLGAWRGGLAVALANDLVEQEGAVSAEVARDFVESHGIPFLDTSAKTGVGCAKDDLASLVTELLVQWSDRSTM